MNDAEVLAILNGGDTSTKKRSNVAPHLETFVKSGQLAEKVDLSLYPAFTAEELVQHFKNAGKATQHNVAEDRPEYKIEGGFHVLPKIVNGDLLLINQKVAERMKADAAKAAAVK